MAGVVVDLFMLYQFLKRLTTPFDETDAFKHGIIDDRGKRIKSKKVKTPEEKNSYRLFDKLVFNLKKIIELVPMGRTRLATYAAALLLLREHEEPSFTDVDNFQLLQEKMIEFMDEKELRTLNETIALKKDINEQFEMIEAMAGKIGCGECFKWAYQQIMEKGHSERLGSHQWSLVQAIVKNPWDGKSYPHAWIENKKVVQDWQTMEIGMSKYKKKGWPRNIFYDTFKPSKVIKYGRDDAIKQLAKANHYGPW
tara:strand:- start:357 stop:1115 length:759 start_codon:yes stop_codon:yes gene_type:complete